METAHLSKTLASSRKPHGDKIQDDTNINLVFCLWISALILCLSRWKKVWKERLTPQHRLQIRLTRYLQLWNRNLPRSQHGESLDDRSRRYLYLYFT
jgi:hypothetical protein